MKETPEAYTVAAEIPGVKKDEIHVEVEGNEVTISAETKREESKDGEKFLRVERYYGKTARRFALPQDAPTEVDVAFHASASAAGLGTAIAAVGNEGTIVEMSWYGDRPVQSSLGGAFHSRRLRLLSSQVGQVSAGHRPRWGHRRRAMAAMGLLRLSALDALVAEEIAFEDAPRELPRILAPGAPGLAPVIRYPDP